MPAPQKSSLPQPTTSDIILSGALAASSVDLLVYPLDTFKTRLQSPAHRHLRFSLRGLYHGIGSVALATIPASGTFFTVYELSRSYAHLPTPLASGLAELASCAVFAPSEVLKQNAQVGGGTRAAFRRVQHWSHLWRGYGALAARNLPFTALQFPVFEALKARWGVGAGVEAAQGMGVARTVGLAGVAAGLSGAVAAVVTTPVDVVKTRIMLDSGRRRRVADVVREVVQGEGFWRGFWRGGALRAVWTFVGSGLYLGVYEGAKVALVERRERLKGEEERGGAVL
ncbi:mitochondrial carrier protein [Geopyxis carbonaria]|nr:mitochondrial carrier protein [Geopyxis carbonaria]